MGIILVGMYGVGVCAALLSLVYFVKDLAADLLLIGAAAAVTFVWIVGACASAYCEFASSSPHDSITLWGYILTGVALPMASIYLAFIERTKWGAAGIGAVALTTIVLGYRLTQLWPGVFA